MGILRKILVLQISLFLFKSSFTQVFPITSLSQNTNFYINTVSDGRTFISSIDGLNIFDGIHTHIYKSSSHNMFGNNIQSNFYQDGDHDVWFVTYQALHVYRKDKDDFEYQFLINNGDTIKHDYRIIDKIGDSLLLSAGSKGFIFDVKKEQVVNQFAVNGESFVDFKLISDGPNWIIIAANENGCHIHEYDSNFKLTNLNVVGNNITALAVEKQFVLASTFNGSLEKINFKKSAIEKSIYLSDKALNSISFFNDSIIFISSSDKIFYYNINSNQIESAHEFQDLNNINIENPSKVILSVDSVLWVSADGEGVFFKDLKKPRFGKWPYTRYDKAPSITGVYTIDSVRILIATRLNGIYIINNNGQTIFHQPDLLKIRKNFTVLDGWKHDKNNFIFTSYGKLYSFDLDSYLINKLKTLNESEEDFFINPTKLKDGTVVVSVYKDKLRKISISETKYELKPYSIDWVDKTITNLKSINDSIFAISINEEYISVIKYLSSDKEFAKLDGINISGGLKSICSINDSSFYLSNVNGLYEINLKSYDFNKIIGPNNEFNQTIYAVIKDSLGLFWMSTNQGILSFDKEENKVRQFTKADGLQGLEFNSHAYHINDQGVIYFGGVNGLNYFDPKDMKPSEEEVPVFVTEYRINDFTTESQGIPMTLTSLILPYDENTLTILFHALDYKDPQSTRVKYKMSKEDKIFVESETAQGLARYANLRPGKYTFTIIGANADGHWNEAKKEIQISILPPYWQTWWFRLLSILSIGGLLFTGVRFYYNQKIKQKDFTLREQALIIEKQQALQNERTRIAGEMHDDLGGGLTSIKYLSQKVIRSLDNEEHKSQVNKIITHAQTLVNNMSEIIWAMNSGFDTLDSLIAYCRRYSRSYMDDNDLDFNFEVKGDTNDIAISGEKRRNIYLIIKEALNNVVKHADATSVNLEFNNYESLIITIRDNGKGLVSQENLLGNGMKNMKNRVHTLSGEISINDKFPGLEITINLPIE